MKTLYLHIGTPKTGTTSIQNFCMDNQKRLEEKGFCFPIFDYPFRNIGKYCNAHFLLTRYWDENGQREYEREEALALDGIGKVLQLFEKSDNIILSDERIWNIGLTEDVNVWQRVKEHILSKGITVKVIVYLRRQDDFLYSWWNQHIKSNNHIYAALSWEELITELPYIQLDYEHVLKQIASYVGKDNICVRIFDKNAFLKNSADGSILADFLNVLNLPYTDEYTVSNPERNPGLTKNNVEIKRLLNNLPNLDKTSDKFFYQRLVEQSKNNTEDRKTSMFSKEEQAAFLARYKDGNARVAKEYLGLDDLFEYSYHAEKKWTRNNEELPEDIIKLFGSTTLYLLQEVNRLQKELDEQNRHINNLRYKLRHPAKTIVQKMRKDKND